MARLFTLAILGGTLAAFALGAISLAAQPANRVNSPDTGGDVGANTSIALDANGYPRASYNEISTDRQRLMRCYDGDCGGSKNIIVVSSSPRIGTAIAIDSLGRTIFAGGGGGSARCEDQLCTVREGLSAYIDGRYPSIAIASDDTLTSIYYQDFSGFLAMTDCPDVDCDDLTGYVRPDYPNTSGPYSSLTLDTNDFPVISVYDAANNELKVIRCAHTGCFSGITSVPVDTGGDVGYYSSVDLDASGYPVVAYYDTTNADLKVIHCGSSDCATGNVIEAPDTGGDVGRWPSLQLDAAGRPVVSYYDATNGDLKILRCGDATCSSANSIVSVDTIGDVGRSTSLALDAYDSPVVSYYDATRGDLKVLHCGPINCEPDLDNDGCPDHLELVTTVGSEQFGGKRSPENPFDFYDSNGDHVIDLFIDIFSVAGAFGLTSSDAGYDATLDRSAPAMGMHPWDMGAPDGEVDLFTDIFGVAYQFGHACA